MPNAKSLKLLLSAALFAALPATAAEVDVLEGKLVTRSRDGSVNTLSLPVPATRAFGVVGGRVLVGAEPRAVAPASDEAGGMNLWTVSLDGKDSRRLLAGQGVLRVAVSEPAGLAAVSTRDLTVLVIDLEGREVSRLERAASPAFSPDGRRLTVAVPPKEWQPGALPGGFDLHVVDLATGERRELTAGYDDAEPIWAPDGRTLLFLSGMRTGLTSFWRIDAQGGEPEQVTNVGEISAKSERFVPNPSANTDIRWSEDGTKLLYGASYSEAGEVMVLSFGPRYEAREARDLGAGRSPAWGEGGTVQVLRAGARGPVVDELSSDDEAVRRMIEISGAAGPARTAWRPARGTEVLAGLASSDKTHTNPPRYRWPLSFQPAGQRYFYDNNSAAGVIRSWKCNGETYDGHRGTDAPAACGNAVYAGHDGPVWNRNDGCPNVGFWGSTCGGGFGNYVRLNNGNNWFSIYAHMQSGTPVGFITVGCGQYIGTSYTSGNSTGCHLHFEVQHYGYPADDPFAGSCSGPESFWCNQNGDGAGLPGRVCC